MADLTVEILKEIRDEARLTNERLGRVERRQVETEVRLATELTSVVSAIRDLKDAIMADRDVRGDIADHERRIQVLESKTG